ncbi:MAG: EAL domain-containing protein [Gallionellaceae bacterium]
MVKSQSAPTSLLQTMLNPIAREAKLVKITNVIKKSSFSKLLRKLLIGFIALGIFLFALFCYKSWEDENHDMRSNLAIQAGFAQKSSQAIFDNIGISMEMLGQLLTKSNVLAYPEVARQALIEYISKHSEVIAVSLISPNGKVLLSTLALQSEGLHDLRKNESSFQSFLFDLNNTYSYSLDRNQYGMGIKQWHFPFRHTVQIIDGNPLFVIQAAISAESAALLWSDLPLYPGSRVGLIRSDGYLQMFWPTENPEKIYNKPQSGTLLQTLNANAGMISGAYEGKSSIDNTVRVGAFSHLPNANMFAFVSVPKRLIMTRWWEHNYPMLIGFFVYLSVIIIIAYKLSAMELRHTHDLRDESLKDPLTKLPNRLAADEILTREVSRDQRDKSNFALLYLDLDKFKDINDKLGHTSGDQLLEQVALRIRTILRDEDVLARIGGDEFLVILPNSNAEKSSYAAQRIVEIFVAPLHVLDQEIVVSISIGICIFPDNGNEKNALLQNADAAMYEAKKQGGNRYAFYQKEIGERIRQRLQLHHDLLRALERQEFIIYYQPLVDLKNGQIIGAEALVRWMDPHKGLRNPAEFIPYAEESGLILVLGEWVLKNACQEARSWSDLGHDIYIAVNLSTRQFQDPDLFAKINSILFESCLPASKLELEITESASMLDPEASIQVMDKLKSLGIKIAIDDFGTGYSSLSYLKRIPADIIKIDKSFVQGVHLDQDDLAIVRTILALANSLEKRCLAEGIETAEQFEILNDMGCHFGQGYWMNKPIPAMDFINILKSGKGYFHKPLDTVTE